MSPDRETYPVDLAGLRRELPLFQVAPGLRIAILNILGDTELVQRCADELARRLQGKAFDLLVTAEAKSIPLAHALSVATGKRYIVLRKAYKPYMGESVQAETHSITTGASQTLYLDEKDRALPTVAAEAAICTEGERAKWQDIVALAHLPLFTE